VSKTARWLLIFSYDFCRWINVWIFTTKARN